MSPAFLEELERAAYVRGDTATANLIAGVLDAEAELVAQRLRDSDQHAADVNAAWAKGYSVGEEEGYRAGLQDAREDRQRRLALFFV